MKALRQFSMRFFLISLLSIAFALSGCASKSKKYKNINDNMVQSREVNPEVDAEVEEVGIGNTVYFDFDDDKLPASVAKLLSEQLKALSLNDNLTVIIEGHCDRVGTREYNIGLGARRAENVKRYFISCGVPAEKIETISFGKERLASFGTNPEDDAKNRRAVVILKDLTKD